MACVWTKTFPALMRAAIALSVVGACVPLPIPNKVLLRPEILGEVRAGGAPAAGVPISVARDFSGPSCLPGSPSVVTDADGRFTFQKKVVVSPAVLVPLVPLHKIYRFALCYERDGVGRTLFSMSDYTLYSRGLGPIPKQFVLACDLSPDSAPQPQAKQTGLCADLTQRPAIKRGRSQG